MLSPSSGLEMDVFWPSICATGRVSAREASSGQMRAQRAWHKLPSPSAMGAGFHKPCGWTLMMHFAFIFVSRALNGRHRTATLTLSPILYDTAAQLDSRSAGQPGGKNRWRSLQSVSFGGAQVLLTMPSTARLCSSIHRTKQVGPSRRAGPPAS